MGLYFVILTRPTIPKPSLETPDQNHSYAIRSAGATLKHFLNQPYWQHQVKLKLKLKLKHSVIDLREREREREREISVERYGVGHASFKGHETHRLEAPSESPLPLPNPTHSLHPGVLGGPGPA
jgi:hypothetical protein